MKYSPACLIATLFLLSGCSEALHLPATSPTAQTASSSAAYSAVRMPASYWAAHRGTESLSASPYPLSAVMYPLTAVAYPLTAVPYPSTAQLTTQSVCVEVDKSSQCGAQVNILAGFNPDPKAQPNQIPGLQPNEIASVYDIPSGGGDGITVAIVSAFDDPNAEADLGVYRQAFGLPPCTSANGCFKKIAGTGSSLPATSAAWSVEDSLDLDAVSLVCAHCKLMLVESPSGNIPDLAAAVDTAVASGAQIVSNSYGVAEAADNVQYASHYQHAGVPITAPAGDVGYGPQFPASVPQVTAVGGTSLTQLPAGGLQEQVWPLTGSGCSAFFAKPSWQSDTLCTGRTLNDVSIIGDPADGISVYDSTLPNSASGGWSAIGGTSMGAPLIAGFFAIASKNSSLGSNATLYAVAAKNPTKNPNLINVTLGSNGTCPVTLLCQGGPGYNGPSGNGVPWTAAAFAPAH